MIEFDAAMRQKGLEVRRARKAEIDANYKLDWLDAFWWEELAQKRGVRLPGWYAKTSANAISRWLKRLKSTGCKAEYGCTAKRLLELNPKTPLRAFVGQMLEP